MKSFAYAEPATLQEAVALLAEHGDRAAVLAGGTDLLSLMKDFVVEPDVLVSLRQVGAARGLRVDGDTLRLGALATLDDLLANAPASQGWPALAQAAEGVASAQLRAMGTIGGELLQRPRCWYFRRGFGLLAMRDGASMVEAGDNRYHAVFGNGGPAKFVSPSSLAPALIAHGAVAEVEGPRGSREVAVADLFVIPEREGDSEHALARDEILAAVRVPRAAHAATYEIRPRAGLDWPEAAAAAVLEMAGRTVRSVKLVLGHVAPKPWVVDVSEALVGKELDATAAAAAGELAVRGARPLSRNGHKIELAKVAAKRAILRAAGDEV